MTQTFFQKNPHQKSPPGAIPGGRSGNPGGAKGRSRNTFKSEWPRTAHKRVRGKIRVLSHQELNVHESTRPRTSWRRRAPSRSLPRTCGWRQRMCVFSREREKRGLGRVTPHFMYTRRHARRTLGIPGVPPHCYKVRVHFRAGWMFCAMPTDSRPRDALLQL